MIHQNNTQFLHHISESANSFAAWRLPSDTGFNLVASDQSVIITDIAEAENADGFIISPFDIDKHPIVFIPAQFKKIGSDITGEYQQKQSPNNKSDEVFYLASQSEYLEQAEYLISEIRNNVVNKVILSRLQCEQAVAQCPSILFERLCEKYPGAYVFWFNTPETGMWMGASPELFVESKSGIAKTVALAGTRKNRSALVNDEKWHQKEIDEQAIVTSYIEDVLSRYDVKEIKKDGPFTINAGQVSHIKTTFDFATPTETNDLMKLIFDLHPTPAVCGIPKDVAKMLINQTEKHDRQYYGGFMGYVNNGDIDCYVNIRSMKIVNDDAYLFVGGGLTHQSDSHAEWHETTLKAQTILSVLKNS